LQLFEGQFFKACQVAFKPVAAGRPDLKNKRNVDTHIR